jgi:polysaccharide export outer membrane protein
MKTQKIRFIAVFVALFLAFLILKTTAIAGPEEVGSAESLKVDTTTVRSNNFDPLKYTLGPEDVIEISVMRHPEFSGTYPINKEGKIQYKFVGDIDVNELNKIELEEKIKNALSLYVNSPEVSVTIITYGSKFFYVLGEVGAPGKYYMQAESIPVREAIFDAGLPTAAAAMRKCQLITPSSKGRAKIRGVDLYSILYHGNLKKNISIKPGDVLYVPSTIMAKIVRVISPVASTVGLASAGPDSAATGRTATETLRGKPY